MGGMAQGRHLEGRGTGGGMDMGRVEGGLVGRVAALVAGANALTTVVIIGIRYFC